MWRLFCPYLFLISLLVHRRVVVLRDVCSSWVFSSIFLVSMRCEVRYIQCRKLYCITQEAFFSFLDPLKM